MIPRGAPRIPAAQARGQVAAAPQPACSRRPPPSCSETSRTAQRPALLARCRGGGATPQAPESLSGGAAQGSRTTLVRCPPSKMRCTAAALTRRSCSSVRTEKRTSFTMFVFRRSLCRGQGLLPEVPIPKLQRIWARVRAARRFRACWVAFIVPVFCAAPSPFSALRPPCHQASRIGTLGAWNWDRPVRGKEAWPQVRDKQPCMTAAGDSQDKASPGVPRGGPTPHPQRCAVLLIWTESRALLP